MARSGIYSIYKKIGQAQFSLIPPTRDPEKGFVVRDGAIFIEAAPGMNGGKEWDWNKKIRFSLGLNDIAILLEDLDNPKKLIHKIEESNILKSLEFTPGQGNYEGTYMMKLTHKAEDTNLMVSVPLSSGEFQILVSMMKSSLPYMVGWLS